MTGANPRAGCNEGCSIDADCIEEQCPKCRYPDGGGTRKVCRPGVTDVVPAGCGGQCKGDNWCTQDPDCPKCLTRKGEMFGTCIGKGDITKECVDDAGCAKACGQDAQGKDIPGTCVDGICTCPDPPPDPELSTCKTDDECSTFCQGKPGTCTTFTDPATKKKYKKCACTGGGDEPFVPGEEIIGECPEGKGEKAYTGCKCGREYTTMTGNCPEGYVHVPRSGTGWNGWKKGAVGRCECIKYCEENGYGSDCQGGGTVGEYKYPPEMDALMKLLLARANALIQMPTGYSQNEINKMFGAGFEGIKGREASKRNQEEEYLSREGMLGTGTASGKMRDIASEGEANVTDLMRQIFLANQGQKRQDLKDYTGLSQSLMGTGMGFESLMESINAARRGEKNSALLLWLQLLQLFKG